MSKPESIFWADEFSAGTTRSEEAVVSDTPRTDRSAFDYGAPDGRGCRRSDMQELEKELTAERDMKLRTLLNAQQESADRLQAERDALREALRRIEQALLPDPHDEREVSLPWLRSTIHAAINRVKEAGK